MPIAPLIANRRAEIDSLCREHGVRRLVLFGSAARGGDFDAQRSDVDFLYNFLDEEDKSRILEREWAFQDALAASLGCKVDLIPDRPFRNPYLQQSMTKIGSRSMKRDARDYSPGSSSARRVQRRRARLSLLVNAAGASAPLATGARPGSGRLPRWSR